MKFSDPVESMNAIAGELREAEAKAPPALRELLIRASDAFDDQQKRLQDAEQAINLASSLMLELADKLETAAEVKISQMDSPSRAAEKTQEAQRQILDVARKMREVAKL